MIGISPHRLRDAFAIHAIKFDDSGDGLGLLQEHLSHQSITTTMRYRKVAGEEHRNGIKNFGTVRRIPMMLPLRPPRGGYTRRFVCGLFIRDFLLGYGPEGSTAIDPQRGS